MGEVTVTETFEGESLKSGHGLSQMLFLQSTSVLESYGGIEYYLDDLQTDLAKLLGESQVCVLLPGRRFAESLPEKHYRYEVVPFRKHGLLGRIENRFSRAMWRMAMENIRANQPTHLVCGHVHLAPFVYLLSMRTGIPFIVCTYGIEAWGDLRWIEEHALSQADCILTISEWTKRMLRKRGYPAHSIHVVHPRLPSEFENIPAPVAKGRKPRPLRLITVSRLAKEERYKGQDHVIDALARIQLTEGHMPFEYWIVGDGTDLGRLRDLVKQRNLEDSVHFFPPVATRQDLIRYYRQCDLFVMPSRFGRWDGRWRGEGFGIVYLEAGACGLPSVAYNCGGATDIIQHGRNGLLVEPDDTSELARSLWDLYLQPDRIDHMAKQAHIDVMERFTRPAIRKEILTWVRALSKE